MTCHWCAAVVNIFSPCQSIWCPPCANVRWARWKCERTIAQCGKRTKRFSLARSYICVRSPSCQKSPELKCECCGDKKKEFVPLWVRSARIRKKKKNTRAVKCFMHTSRSTREVLMHHHAFDLPKRPRVAGPLCPQDSFASGHTCSCESTQGTKSTGLAAWRRYTTCNARPQFPKPYHGHASAATRHFERRVLETVASLWLVRASPDVRAQDQELL